MIHLLRASHANEFELQNYVGIKDLQVITSQHPLTNISLPSTKLWSPTDLPNFPFRRQLLNRLIGGEQWLIGLEKSLSSCIDESIHRIIVHTAETYTPYTHQAVELRKRGVISKLVCTCWETIPHNNEKFGRVRKWKADAYRYVDIFHTPTERAKQALVTEGVDPNKIIVIPYGVDLTRFKPASLPACLRRQGVSRKGNRPVVLTIARLEKVKGMEDLEAVAKALPQYDFRVIGRGSCMPKGDNITVTTVDYINIHKEYQKADLFFLPSVTTATWEEQYGMVLVEAMACGLPIVATHTGAIPEVVGPAAILVKERNVSDMTTAINSILSSKSKIKSLSLAGTSRTIRLYDATKIALQLSTVYH